MKTFGISDAMRILDIPRDRLFYWLKHWRFTEPEIEGKGRGGRTRLSFKNIIALGVVKELARLGIDFNAIKEVFKTWVGIETIEKKRFSNILDWAIFEYGKEENKDKDFYLVIYRSEYDNSWGTLPLGVNVDIGLTGVFNLKGDGLAQIVVELFGMIRTVEAKITED